MNYTYDDSIYSDFHKEAYGFRPDSIALHKWKTSTPGVKQKEWDHLDLICKENMEQQVAIETEAIVEFENKILIKMDTTAADRKEAIRQILQDIDVKGDSVYTAGYACYVLGLPFEMADAIVESYS